MKLNVWAATITGGVLSAVGLALVAVLFKLTGGGGQIILRAYDGLCPGYQPHTGAANLVLGLIVALIQGAIIALVVSGVYNVCVGLLTKKSQAAPASGEAKS